MIEKLIKHLQDKHDAFIGNQKDQITSAEARGFKQGLAWAIESAESQIREAQAEGKVKTKEEAMAYAHRLLGSASKFN